MISENKYKQRVGQVSAELSQLKLPSDSHCKLVLMMIRHVTLVISYFIALVMLRGVIPSVIPQCPVISNITDIVTNWIILMLFPLGTPSYQLLCLYPTSSIFFQWYDTYADKKTVAVEELIEKSRSTSSKVASSRHIEIEQTG